MQRHFDCHVDPYGKLADCGTLPKADLVLITHEHGDYLDANALGKVRKADTAVAANAAAGEQVNGAVVLKRLSVPLDRKQSVTLSSPPFPKGDFLMA